MLDEQKKKFLHWQAVSLYLVLYDVIAIVFSYFLGLWIRFDCRFQNIPHTYLKIYYESIWGYALICIVIFWAFKLYRSIWRFASYIELCRTLAASVLTCLIQMVGGMYFYGRMPMTYYVIGTGMQFVFIIGIRFAYRFVLLLRGSRSAMEKVNQPVMLIGAGAAGRMILRDIQCSNRTKEKVCCIIDDNPNKWGRYIDGVLVEGGRDDILSCVEKYGIKKIYVAIPSMPRKEKANLLNICKETGCELKDLPGMYQLYQGDISIRSMHDVNIEDLLGRDPIQVDLEEIFDYLKGKVIMVTGGGGSIGSELCRQIAAHSPKQLIIFEIYENNAYEIEQELKKKYPNLNLTVLIGSVRDSRRIHQVFAQYRPEVVYHAAAHKHVPLMEGSPCEAIKNNAIGTYKTAYAAMINGCKRFVLISTDKAVNPTNIMGASKRLCEMIIQAFDRMVKEGRADELPLLFGHAQDEDGSMENFRNQLPAQINTEFVAVRFGNVLGSNGSVIPLFKKQIQSGGPVTVTHPDIIRYFMTIPEAVSLVLQAGIHASGGEIFVLDMGDPVKIDDLARNLIKLSGYTPEVDIKIEYTGLRPGEKLYEEKLMVEEGLKTTRNKLIHIGCPIAFDTTEFLASLKKLMQVAYNNADVEELKSLVKEIVTTYHPQ